jgi:hypothetical protein
MGAEPPYTNQSPAHQIRERISHAQTILGHSIVITNTISISYDNRLLLEWPM